MALATLPAALTHRPARVSISHYSSLGTGTCLGSELSLKAYEPKLLSPHILKSYPMLLLPDISQVATMQIEKPPLRAVLF